MVCLCLAISGQLALWSMKISVNRRPVDQAPGEGAGSVPFARVRFLSVLQPEVRVVEIRKSAGRFSGLKAFHLPDETQIWIRDSSAARSYRIILRSATETDLAQIFDDFVSGETGWKTKWKWAPSTPEREPGAKIKIYLVTMIVLALGIAAFSGMAATIDFVIFAYLIFVVPRLFPFSCNRRRRRRTFWLYGYQVRFWNSISSLPVLSAYFVAYRHADYGAVWLGILILTSLFDILIATLQLKLSWMPVFRDNKHMQSRPGGESVVLVLRLAIIVFWVVSWFPRISEIISRVL